MRDQAPPAALDAAVKARFRCAAPVSLPACPREGSRSCAAHSTTISAPLQRPSAMAVDAACSHRADPPVGTRILRTWLPRAEKTALHAI